MGKLDEKTLIGTTYGNWYVLDAERRQSGNRERIYIKVQCHCGNIVWKPTDHAKRDTSCGCNQYKGTERTDIARLIGETYENMIILDSRRNRNAGWAVIEVLVRCSVCGTEKWVAYNNFKGGHYRSCGCKKLEYIGDSHRTHGEAHSRLYNIFYGMYDRCYREGCSNYRRYGARGIRICDEWLHNYDAFSTWAYANGYTEDLTIDRLDIDKGYSPENCRWATVLQQSRNTSRTRWVTMGDEAKSLSEWCEIYHIAQSVVHGRLRMGWEMERALVTPVKIIHRKVKNDRQGT